jgi:hypothetical protein
MENEIILKYYIQDGQLYELVYTINSSFTEPLPQSAKHQLDEQIKSASRSIISNVEPQIRNLEADDLRDITSIKTANFSALEDALNEQLVNLRDKTASIFYKFHPHIKSALTGAASVHITNFAHLSLQEMLRAWTELYIPSKVAELEALSSTSEKITFFKNELANALPAWDKAELLENITIQLSSFLSGPHTLSDLSIQEFADLFEIVGMCMTPQASCMEEVLLHLHKTLKDNKTLIDHLKPFKDPNLSKKILKESVETRVHSLHEDSKKIAHEIDEESIDSKFYDVIAYESSKMISSKAHFLSSLLQFITQTRPKIADCPWVLDRHLSSYAPLPEDWREITDAELDKIVKTDTNNPADITAAIVSLKAKLKPVIDAGASLSVTRFKGHTPEKIDIKSFADLERLIASMPEKAQMQILSFLDKETLDLDFTKTLSDGKAVTAQPLRYNFFLNIINHNFYCIGYDAELLIEEKTAAKRSYRQIKSTKAFIAQNGPLTAPEGHVKSYIKEITPFDPENVLFALDNLTHHSLKEDDFHIL